MGIVKFRRFNFRRLYCLVSAFGEECQLRGCLYVAFPDEGGSPNQWNVGTFTRLYGVTSRETAVFTRTAVVASLATFRPLRLQHRHPLWCYMRSDRCDLLIPDCDFFICQCLPSCLSTGGSLGQLNGLVVKLQSSAGFKNAWNYTSASPYCFVQFPLSTIASS